MQLILGDNLFTVLALSLNSVANVTLSSLRKVLAEMKHGCPAWFGCLHPHLLLDTKRLLAALREGDNAKVPGTDPSYWELMCSEFGDLFEKPSTPSERAIK